MSVIRFQTKLFTIGSSTIILLPKAASAQLPSRGQTMIKGIINGQSFQAVLEPDGRGSHYFKSNDILPHAKAGDTAQLEIESTKDWSEPNLPTDLKKALSSDTKAYALWNSVTPMAHWDWIRWIGSTKNPETRQKHVDVTLSKLKKGEKRPCCFNRSLCCDTTVSKNGILLSPIS